MAKELPYFKFEPAEYITKDISFCSYAAQGLFINLCSHYWQRNCEMTYTQAERRFKDKELLNELLEEGVISHQNGKLIIKFLIKQREEAIERSSVNKANGSKGGRPKKPKQKPEETEKKPNGYDSLSETKGIRRDKIIEEEIKEEKIIKDNILYDIDDLVNFYLTNEKIVKAFIGNDKNKVSSFDILKSRLNDFKNSLEETGEDRKEFKDFCSHFRNWNSKIKPKVNSTNKILL